MIYLLLFIVYFGTGAIGYNFIGANEQSGYTILGAIEYVPYFVISLILSIVAGKFFQFILRKVRHQN